MPVVEEEAVGSPDPEVAVIAYVLGEVTDLSVEDARSLAHRTVQRLHE